MQTIRSLTAAALLALTLWVGPGIASEAGTPAPEQTAAWAASGMKGPYRTYRDAKKAADEMRKTGYKAWVTRKSGSYYCAYKVRAPEDTIGPAQVP